MSGYQHKQFDVDVSITLDASRLSWPRRGEALDENSLGMNRMYFDIRGIGWRDVVAMIQVERDIIFRIANSSAPDDEAEAVEEELAEAWDVAGRHLLWGLDLGVAGATLALSAAGCVPYSSCNGGAFGPRRHAEAYPLIAFFMRPRTAHIVAGAAKVAGVGLYQHGDGSLQVFGSDIGHILDFADAIYAQRRQFRRQHIRPLDG